MVCGGLGFSVYYYVESAVSPQTDQQINVGDSQDRVRELTGGDNTVARRMGQAEQPASSARTTCE